LPDKPGTPWRYLLNTVFKVSAVPWEVHPAPFTPRPAGG